MKRTGKMGWTEKKMANKVAKTEILKIWQQELATRVRKVN